LARRRRRRTEGGADNLDELEDDDDLDIRITSVEEELQNISLSSLNQQRETQSLRVKLDKLAAELKEGDEDDEVFAEIDQLKSLVNQLNEQVTGSQAILIDRLNSLVNRLDQVGGLGPLEDVPGQIERRIDEQLRYLTERLEERLASMEAAREEESDLAATRIEELSSQVEGVINALRDEMEQVLLDTRQTFANDLEAVNLAIQSGGNVQEQVQALGAELQGRITTLTGEIEQNLNALESTVGASLEASQQEMQESLAQIRGELAPLADLQANMTDVVEALDAKAGAEELAELRQSLDDLKKAVSDTASLSEKSRQALDLVNKLEASVTNMDERYAKIAQRSEESAQKAEAHQDKVNLAVKLVDALEERVRGGNFGSGSASTASAEPITDEDLDTPEKTELGFELKDLLQVMVKHQASDLHLKVGAPPTVRLEGELIPVGNANLGGEDCRRLVFSALSRPNRRQLLLKKCLDFTYEMVPGTRFRANAFLERGYMSAAFKMVRAEIPSLEELGLPGITKKLASYQSGLVLVTGPYGSNTPLAMASMVEFLNTNRKVHIITLEDPIEFYYKNKQTCIITQREIGNDAPSFKVAIREALRQDPDVITLSDVPDAETMLAAVNAADSGRLVLAGMNTASAVQTLDRILDGFVGATQRQVRMQLASSLRGVLCLRLLPRADRKGRVYAAEVLVGNAAVSQAILEGRLGELFQHMQSATNEGMQTLAQSLARLYEAGLITKEDAVAHHVGGGAEAAMAASYSAPPVAPPASGGAPLGAPAAAGVAPAATPPPPAATGQQPPAAAMSEDTLMNWL